MTKTFNTLFHLINFLYILIMFMNHNNIIMDFIVYYSIVIMSS